MAKQTRVVTDYTDDMTGLEIAEEVTEEGLKFGIDGADFTMDTHGDAANELREMLARWVANGAIKVERHVYVAPRPKRKPVDPVRIALIQKIRRWAKFMEVPCPEMGRVPGKVQEAFRKSNPDVDMTPLSR
ncbi:MULTISPECIES: Lsr2 dimerization domain-containing protein [unclassified Streptomyces]|uniref:Lsr2 dimerization domain-containing protein n=1 Tax=unclassified Streptomyces TaxID=2593676 RepID=UPI0022AED69F|nr:MULTISPECIES: histone-like nucleoid-structuring protein Lsr2 [unclassified Streptomyces]MCZ4097303.1 Lsr2 family protein [Streptomyces sp. H39-C1]MCZ4120607.1 Lsr2 family protein [Streptomyces sp. H39-S7]